MDQEWQRLQQIYAGLSDGELLNLAASKGELTVVAQQALEARLQGVPLRARAQQLRAQPRHARRQLHARIIRVAEP